jgi:stress-induced morphogen
MCVWIKGRSPKFKNLSGSERQTYVYDALNSKLGAEAQAVSLVSAYSPDEL